MPEQLVVDGDDGVDERGDACLGGESSCARCADRHRGEAQARRSLVLVLGSALALEDLDGEAQHRGRSRRRELFTGDFARGTEPDDEGAWRVRAAIVSGRAVDDDRLADLLGKLPEHQTGREPTAEAGVEEQAGTIERNPAVVADHQRVGGVLETAMDGGNRDGLCVQVLVLGCRIGAIRFGVGARRLRHDWARRGADRDG